MESDFYTFMIIGTINCTYGVFSPNQRFNHTMEAIESVKRKVPDAKILLIDNSIEPLPQYWVDHIEQNVTVFHQMKHNLFSIIANLDRKKSPAETNMMWEGFNLLKQHNLIGKRIFKLSGRYKVSDSFDIREFENPAMRGKYTFAPLEVETTHDGWKNRRRMMWLQTGLISFDPILIDEFQEMMSSIMRHYEIDREMIIEASLFQHVPHSKIFPVEREHAEGFKADGDGYIYF